MSENGIGSRPAASHAASTRAFIGLSSSRVANAVLYSSAQRAASAAARRPALPPMISGGGGGWAGFGGAATPSSEEGAPPEENGDSGHLPCTNSSCSASKFLP